ncbi:hypothetical protein EP7_005078 [Isosphaeraceae bacterium EP7]
MDFLTRIIFGLMAFDAVIVAVFYLKLRSTSPIDEKTLSASGLGLLMFVVHALFFFKGALLIIQLVSIAALFAICQLQHMGKISKSSLVPSKK